VQLADDEEEAHAYDGGVKRVFWTLLNNSASTCTLRHNIWFRLFKVKRDENVEVEEEEEEEGGWKYSIFVIMFIIIFLFQREKSGERSKRESKEI